MSINGPIFAIVTPFDGDGNIDETALINYLSFLEQAEVTSIVVNGTTGEFASLTFEEKIKVLKITKKHFSGKIISHISSCCYRETNELAKLSEDADALLLLPPYYYDIKNRAGLVAFYQRALARISTPTYIYNFPYHTKVNLSREDVTQIFYACDNIVGLKDSGGDIELSKQFALVSKGFDVFVGGDNVALNVLDIGLKGSVTGAGNPFPEFLVGINKEWNNGKHQFAEEIQKKFDIWNKFRGQLSGYEISIVKEVLSKRIDGFPTGTRSPLIPLDESDKRSIDREYPNLYENATKLYS